MGLTPERLRATGTRAGKRQVGRFLIEGEQVTYTDMAARLGIHPKAARSRFKTECRKPGPVTWAGLER